MRRLFSFITLSLTMAMLGACQTQPAKVYQTESFETDSPFEYTSLRTPTDVCEVGKRALLSQGYQVDDSKPLNMRGEKYFQPSGEQATRLTISLVCLPSISEGSVIYANALETQYALKASGTSTGLSVSGIGSVSLPWAVGRDSLTKVGESTVTAPKFYGRLFDLIKSIDSQN